MQSRPQEGIVVDGDRVERLHRWLDQHADWIRRQEKAKIIIHMAGKAVEIEIGLGKEKI